MSTPADKKILQLDPASVLNPADFFVLARTGQNNRLQAQVLLTQLEAVIAQAIADLPPAAPVVDSFNTRKGDVVLLSSDLNGLDGSGLSGVGTGTGGVINTGTTTIGADSDADGVGVIALQTRGVTRQAIANDGAQEFWGQAAPALSPADKARVYFDAALNQLMISQAGSPYTPLFGGGGFLSVKSYGATGDGTTDDTAAVNAAIAAALALGAEVFFPSGTYKLNSVTFTVPVIMAPGARWYRNTGQTITITKSFSADPTPHFIGPGLTSFTGNQVVSDLPAVWWAASGAKSSTAIDPTFTRTTGSTAAGATTVGVTSGTTFANGDTVKISGAGPAGGVYRGVILAGGGTASWTMFPAIHTAVAAGAAVLHGDNNITTRTTAIAAAAATSITVLDASTFAVGQGIYLSGGGAAAGGSFLPHIAIVSSVAAGVIGFSPALVTGIASGALVMHDDTAAIQAAINAGATLRGARVQLSAGVFMCNRPDQTSTGGVAGTLLWPDAPCCADVTKALVLEGVPRPPALAPSFSGNEVSTGGSIIQTDTAGGAALITGKTTSYGFLMINLTIKEIHLRLYDDPQKSGLDLSWVNIAHVNSITVDTGTPTAAITQPTNANATGIYGPGPLNTSFVLRDAYVYGFRKGILVGEHADIADCVTQYNLVGYEFPAADYPILLGSLISNQDAVHFKVTGAVAFANEGLLKSEHWWASSGAPAWTASVYDIEDPGNLARGKLSIFVWDPGVNRSIFYTKNGGANLQLRLVGTRDNGTARNFSDSFEDTVINSHRWGIGTLFAATNGAAAGTVTQTGGALQITPAVSAAATSRVKGLVTREWFDFITGRTATVKVTQIASAGADTYFILGPDDGNIYGMTASGGNLIFSGLYGGGVSSITFATVAYNATNHLWWRFRFADGVMYAETSPDGTTWTLLGSAGGTSALFAPNRVRLSLEAGVYTSVASPGVAIFDNFSIS